MHLAGRQLGEARGGRLHAEGRAVEPVGPGCEPWPPLQLHILRQKMSVMAVRPIYLTRFGGSKCTHAGDVAKAVYKRCFPLPLPYTSIGLFLKTDPGIVLYSKASALSFHIRKPEVVKLPSGRAAVDSCSGSALHNSGGRHREGAAPELEELGPFTCRSTARTSRDYQISLENAKDCAKISRHHNSYRKFYNYPVYTDPLSEV